MNSRWMSCSLAVLTLSLLLACSNNPDVVTPPERVVEVEMTDELNFEPQTVSIQVGATVRWHNTSSIQHTVTADPEKAAQPTNVVLPEGAEPFDSGLLEPGESFEQTFEVPGTYRYVCLPHEEMEMLGEIRVVPAR